MAAKELLGPAAFYVGLLISLVAAFAAEASGTLYAVLAVLGIIVALLNITAEEVNAFILSSLAFILSAFAMHSMIGATGVILDERLVRLAANISVLLGAGVVVIALKAIYKMARAR